MINIKAENKEIENRIIEKIYKTKRIWGEDQ